MWAQAAVVDLRVRICHSMEMAQRDLELYDLQMVAAAALDAMRGEWGKRGGNGGC